MTLDLNDHLLQAPDGLLATLLGNFLREVFLGLVGILLGTAHLRGGNRCGIAAFVLSNGSRGETCLVLVRF